MAALSLVPRLSAQQPAAPPPISPSGAVTIQGVVLDASGKPVAGAAVQIAEKGPDYTARSTTDSKGSFIFAGLPAGSYQLTAQKSDLRGTAQVTPSAINDPSVVHLVLNPVTSASAAMQFADEPNFTVAGVTDWTAVGGHGSDATLRTSEALARETLTLKANGTATGSSSTPSDRHRLAGERAEKAGDPLAAVHEFEQAARLDPSEENYFEWGTELLLHRAVWQAQEVFLEGVQAYPKSARMLTALGTALFAGAKYEDAAQRLCEASDLDPNNPEPYTFLGKIEMAAPTPLACVEQKLARFSRQQPDNPVADYLYAMALLKRQQQPADKALNEQAGALLTKAVAADPKCADGYLQLGILAFSQRHIPEAISLYAKAIEANPKLSEAHYRLGVAYDRAGEPVKAKEQFALHDQIEKQQAEAVEQQRREVKQFLVVLQEQSRSPQSK